MRVIQKNNNYIKKHRKFPILGTTPEQRLQLEIDSLLLLQKQYKCTCGKNAKHFPELKAVNFNKITITNQGLSLNLIKDKIEIYEPIKQFECIHENLKRCKIKYLDPKWTNICINESGDISLIDFEIVVINNEPISLELKELDKKYTYSEIRNKLYKIFLKRT
tara:strand:+ start:570 stop:1058 length:489 start_codon:yes stop_codon:yes gene_type:complete